jgi:hypothetical protein
MQLANCGKAHLPRERMTSMRFSLRTLLIMMMLAGPLSALGWSKFNAWLIWREEQAIRSQLNWSSAIMTIRQIPPVQLRVIYEEDHHDARRPTLVGELEQEDPDIVVLRCDLRKAP